MGGLNLYGMAGNDAVNDIDFLGLCGCSVENINAGSDWLRIQEARTKRNLSSGAVSRGSEAVSSCYLDHTILWVSLQVPPCWECRRECRSYLSDPENPERFATPIQMYKFIQTLGVSDHCVVVCRVIEEDGIILIGNTEIILDITGGFKTRKDFVDYYPYSMDDHNSNWK